MSKANAQAKNYVGLDRDKDGGLTPLGRCVMDARVFGLIDADENCTNWSLGQMQVLLDKVNARWDEYGALPSRLPEELRTRHEAEYDRAIERAHAEGWDPDEAL